LDVLFDQMRDPESVRMAAFTAADPGDRAAFDAHMATVRASPEITMRAITREGALVGSIASNALKLLIELVRVRPLYARAASDNARSLRVQEKAGFRPVGTECSYAPGRGAAIEETILRRE
jgi:L-amino acid N-acyltransferase YncA